ncbi:MAG: hypothetical protein CFK52_12680 [Chloracidobacterium sp. CP2_5A]|nr:MAG: hypothetical protein CFK52_12680 [Chloracidobacterium sp. CP2_5A]
MRSVTRVIALVTFMLFLAPSLPARAIPPPQRQLDYLASQLTQRSRDLLERLYGRYQQGPLGQRQLEGLYRAQMLFAASELFERMARENRSEGELRAAINFVRQQALFDAEWRDVRVAIDNAAREIQRGGGGGNLGGGLNPGGGSGLATGRLRWFGRVDENIYLFVRGASTRIELVSGQPTVNERFNFTSPLPRRLVTVQVRKLRGRANIQVIQQPTDTNDFTAVLQITDSGSGATDTEFEMTWSPTVIPR